jgi:hypothetical protein
MNASVWLTMVALVIEAPALVLEQALASATGEGGFLKNSKSFGVSRGLKSCTDSLTPGPTRDFE